MNRKEGTAGVDDGARSPSRHQLRDRPVDELLVLRWDYVARLDGLGRALVVDQRDSQAVGDKAQGRRAVGELSEEAKAGAQTTVDPRARVGVTWLRHNERLDDAFRDFLVVTPQVQVGELAEVDVVRRWRRVRTRRPLLAR